MIRKRNTLFERTLDRTQNKYIGLRYNSRNAALPTVDRLKARIGAIPVRATLTVLDAMDRDVSTREYAQRDRQIGFMSRVATKRRSRQANSEHYLDIRDAMAVEADVEVAEAEIVAEIFDWEITVLDDLRKIADAEGARIADENDTSTWEIPPPPTE